MQAVAAEQSGYAEIFYCFLEREEFKTRNRRSGAANRGEDDWQDAPGVSWVSSCRTTASVTVKIVPKRENQLF
jgi:hypothetical protein